MSVGPSMPTPMTSRIAGHAARAAISWLTMTCSTAPSPWPPYSIGHVTPAQPGVRELAPATRGARRRARPRRPRPETGAAGGVLVQPGPHLRAVLRPAPGCRSGPPRAPFGRLASRIDDHTAPCARSPFAYMQGAATAVVLARLSRGRTRRPPLKAGTSPAADADDQRRHPRARRGRRASRPCLAGLATTPTSTS